MDFFDKMIEFDKSLLLTLNGCHTPFWDNFFWLVTATLTWVPFYAVILYVVVKSQNKGYWFTILAFAVLVLLCDQISNSVFKDVFERLRPSREPSLSGLVNLVAGYKGGKFGFVSSHAANSFGLAMFTLLLFRHRVLGVVIFAWALLNSYSRVYIGLHYPGDILGGAVLGILIGWVLYLAYKRTYPRFANAKHPTRQPGMLGEKVFSDRLMYLLVFSVVFSVVLLLIAAKVYLKMQG